MGEPVVTFTVAGMPQPAGSKRGFLNKHTGRVSVVDDNPKSRGWKTQVAQVATEAFVGGLGGRRLEDGPLTVEMTFYVPRPRGHYGTGRNAQLMKASAPVAPATRPDVLKLARAVEDGLTGVVYRDDAQIVEETLIKRYGEPARCEIRIYRLTTP